jgi:hypothetical protein
MYLALKKYKCFEILMITNLNNFFFLKIKLNEVFDPHDLFFTYKWMLHCIYLITMILKRIALF